MSQFNQPNFQDQQNAQGRKNNSIIYWVIILVLLAGCLYLFMSKNRMAEDNDLKARVEQKKMDSLMLDHASLQTDFDAASAKIDELVSQNSRMDSLLMGDKNEMAKLQSQIRTILVKKDATEAELNKAREMIKSLTNKTKHYEERIAELEKENVVLTGKNVVLTKERDSTVTRNIALKKIGSVLHASNIRMEPIKKKRNGKEKETKRAKKVDVLRIKFDIDENRIAEGGSKQIYLRIAGPDGKILNNVANESGNLTTHTGEQISFSAMKEITLTQGEMVKDVTLDWNQYGDYEKGTYSIEVYHDGYKVGNGNVTLK